MPPMGSPSEISMNMPNTSMLYMAYTPIFGSTNFQMAPSQTGEVNLNNGIIPYVSIEATVFMLQIQSSANPMNTTGGQVTGQQNIQGGLTATDGLGNIRVAISGGGQNAPAISGAF